MTTAVSARMRPFFSVHHGRFGKENRASTFLFDKTDGASEKLKQLHFSLGLFGFSLTLHYLSIR